ncbi:MAG TPA: PhnD/SsuA/transferrin family substrate-binding protein [Opitutaceae bacterium]|nr:PhnD/SsuA/transferrin family substrate-binding protein [Opitutaceae bacterium]
MRQSSAQRRFFSAGFGRLLRAAAVAAVGGYAFCPAVAAPVDNDVIRLGLTAAMLPDLNENDARASIKALATATARERGLAADPEPHVYDGTAAATVGLQRGATNAIGLTTAEYWLIRREIRFDGFLISTLAHDPMERYVVLVPAASPAMALTDLQGHDLTMLRGPQMSLARVWLDVELAGGGHPTSVGYFGRITESGRPSRVVLPLFFGQGDACVVNQRALDTLIELNPQVAKKIRVVATSPPFVPSMFALTRTLSPEFRDRALRELGALDNSIVGQQVLTIFRTQHIAPYPETVLDSALELLDRHARLCPAANAALIGSLRQPKGALTVR